MAQQLFCKVFLCFLALTFAQCAVFNSGQRTDLEKAFTAAWVRRVEDGTWSRLFGHQDSGLIGTDQCQGPAELWEFPKVKGDTSLKDSLEDGEFICGYIPGAQIFTGDGRVLLDTTEAGNTKGLLVEWFFILAQTISEHYDENYRVTWNTDEFLTSSDLLNAVQAGDVDAACGRWQTGGTMAFGPSGTVVRRVDRLSLMNCLSWIQPTDVYTQTASLITTFPELVAAINQNPTFQMCTSTSPDGGSEQLCTTVMTDYVNTPGFQCLGQGSEAWDLLEQGICNAVWLGPPPPRSTPYDFNSFYAPTLTEYGTFFTYEPVRPNSASALHLSFAVVFLMVVVNMF